jgi:hypothetical protein
MKQTSKCVWLVALTTLILLSLACGIARRQAVPLAGVWRDPSTFSETTIVAKGSDFEVASVVDDDGEAYEIIEQSWDGSTISWTYYVPSTGYTVTMESTAIHQDTIECKWWGTAGEGTEILERVR